MYAPIDGTLVIGLGHKARHGKDLAARIIQRAYPDIDIQRFAFADALKSDCRLNHGMTRKDGRLLQNVGVARRESDLNVWLRPVYWAIEERRPAVALVTDMRFENEAEMIRQMGGHAVRVERRLSDGSLFRVADRDPDHASETGLDDYAGFTATIVNPDGDMAGFEYATLSAFLGLWAGRGVNF